MNRRQFLLGLSAVAVSGTTVGGVKLWPESGLTNPCLTELPNALKNHPLMAQVWSGIEANQVWDCHAHIIGAGDSGSGAWFNASMESWQHPILKVQKHFYMNGGCIADAHKDESFVARMTHLASEMPVGYKTMLFAFDYAHNAQGLVEKERSIFHIPNRYAMQMAQQYPQYFEWVASIHPYRSDAIEALTFARTHGARAVKWLPSGMGIDPASPKCDKFYQKLHELDMPIISHTGRESAVQGGDQRFGNPLNMRRALDNGVRVVLAHCASDGEDEDLDNGNQAVKSFDLFTRLMDNPDYATLVYGDISAITLFNHAWVIKPLLARADWHEHLLNGTDYPLPAILPLVSTTQLVRQGLLEEEQLSFLRTLRNYNPLMFDFALKRLLRFEGQSFHASTFHTRHFFERASL